MSHLDSVIQVTLLKSPDLESNVLEHARSRMSHRIHFQSPPPTYPSFASTPERTASELAPVEEWQRPSNRAGLAGRHERVMSWAHTGPGCWAAGDWTACLSSSPNRFSPPWRSQHCMGLNSASWECPQNNQQTFSSQERGWNRRAKRESFALQCHQLYNYKRKSRKPTAWGKKRSPRDSVPFPAYMCAFASCGQNTNLPSFKTTHFITHQWENHTEVPVPNFA